MRSASFFFWSVSQKKRASLKRARSTRSLPRRTKPSGSASMFITATNCGASLPIGVLHREIFLMMPHHRDQHFFGQFQELRVEAAGDGRGIFGEVDQRFEQRRIRLDSNAGQLRSESSRAARRPRESR